MKEQLKDIAVIGSRDFCLGFQLAGVDESYIVEPDEFEETLRDAMEQDLGIVIIHQDKLDMLDRKDRMEIQNAVDPVVVALSRQGESSDLRAKIKKAIGIDLWSDEGESS